MVSAGIMAACELDTQVEARHCTGIRHARRAENRPDRMTDEEYLKHCREQFARFARHFSERCAKLPRVDSPGVDSPGVDSPGVDSPERGFARRGFARRGFARRRTVTGSGGKFHPARRRCGRPVRQRAHAGVEAVHHDTPNSPPSCPGSYCGFLAEIACTTCPMRRSHCFQQLDESRREAAARGESFNLADERAKLLKLQ